MGKLTTSEENDARRPGSMLDRYTSPTERRSAATIPFL